MAITADFFYGVLVLGAALILVQIILQMKWYQIKIWKSIPLVITIILVGLYSSRFWFFVENLYFGGRSLYGAVFLCPVFLYPLAKCLKIQYGEIMDFAAPAGCFVLGLGKFHCMQVGCCGGKVIYVNADYFKIRFPSQIVECVAFIVIALLLLVLSHNIKFRRHIYPIAMVAYGVIRFVLNYFRDVQYNYPFGLSQGSFWSLCSIIIGTGVLMFMHRCTIKTIMARK